MCKFSCLSFNESKPLFRGIKIIEKDKLLVIFDSHGCRDCTNRKEITIKQIYKLRLTLPRTPLNAR